MRVETPPNLSSFSARKSSCARKNFSHTPLIEKVVWVTCHFWKPLKTLFGLITKFLYSNLLLATPRESGCSLRITFNLIRANTSSWQGSTKSWIFTSTLDSAASGEGATHAWHPFIHERVSVNFVAKATEVCFLHPLDPLDGLHEWAVRSTKLPPFLGGGMLKWEQLIPCYWFCAFTPWWRWRPPKGPFNLWLKFLVSILYSFQFNCPFEYQLIIVYPTMDFPYP